jgi:hypothetical protein
MPRVQDLDFYALPRCENVMAHVDIPTAGRIVITRVAGVEWSKSLYDVSFGNTTWHYLTHTVRQ